MAVDRQQILRQDSVGAHLLSSYWFNMEGKEYLKGLIKPLIKQISNDFKSDKIEVHI